MAIETPLGRIIASALIIVDKILSCFVYVNFADATLNCNAADCSVGSPYQGHLTACGQYLVAQVTSMLVSLLSLGSNIFPALGVNVAGTNGSTF